MPHIELPRALEDYFAFAETEPTRNGRRFTISLPYRSGERLDRLQWWYHVSPAQEQMYGGNGLAVLRTQAIERFRRHIERWLENTGQCLLGCGEELIPRVAPRRISGAQAQPPAAMPEAPEPAENVLPWPRDKAANG